MKKQGTWQGSDRVARRSLSGCKNTRTFLKLTSTMAAGDEGYWADVPEDLLEYIGGYLTFDVSDISWRRVCKHWGAGLAKGVPVLALSVPHSVDAGRWDQHMCHLSLRFPRARCFRLDVMLDVPPSLFRDQLAGVAWRCQKLQELQLAFQSRTYEVADEDFGAISTIPDLKVLDIRGGSYETTRDAWSSESRVQSPIRRLSSVKRLKALKFVPGRGGVWNVDLHALAELPNLSTLELKVKSVSDEGLNGLRRLQHLQRLTLHHLWLCNSGPAALTGEGVAGLADLAALLSLHMSVVNLHDMGEGELAALARVKSLGLRARAPGTECVERLCGACRGSLMRLELEHVGLSDSSLLSRLACLPALQDLRLSLHSTALADVHLHLTTLAPLPLKVFHLRLAPTEYPAGHVRVGQGRLLARLDGSSLATLAASWKQLTSLSLQADPSNFVQGALWLLGSFPSLEALSISVHQHAAGPPPHPSRQSPSQCPHSTRPPTQATPVRAWLCALPPRLLHLHLHNVELLPPISHPLHSPPSPVPSPRSSDLDKTTPTLSTLPTSTSTSSSVPTTASTSTSITPATSCRLNPLLSLRLDYCTTPRGLLPYLFPQLPSLSSLRLHEVQPMDDTTIAYLASLSELTSLTVYAPISPRNHAVTQCSLKRLSSRLIRLRELRWVSFDMALGGPKVDAFAGFAGLQLLVLMATQVGESAAQELRAALRARGSECRLQLGSKYEMMDSWHTAFWAY